MWRDSHSSCFGGAEHATSRTILLFLLLPFALCDSIIQDYALSFTFSIANTGTQDISQWHFIWYQCERSVSASSDWKSPWNNSVVFLLFIPYKFIMTMEGNSCQIICMWILELLAWWCGSTENTYVHLSGKKSHSWSMFMVCKMAPI